MANVSKYTVRIYAEPNKALQPTAKPLARFGVG